MTDNRSQIVDPDLYSNNITPKERLAEKLSVAESDKPLTIQLHGRSIHRDASKMSVFFRDGSKSNLSSICHLENKSDIEIDKSDPGNINKFTGEGFIAVRDRSRSKARKDAEAADAASEKLKNGHSPFYGEKNEL